MTTPMRRQYLRIKKQFPDTIVLFRLGDFYETFDEDAKLVAQVCEIVLTSRPVGKDQRVPLAGVPYHAVEGYIAQLIRAGHKVAIVEQMGDVPARGLVDREVVRVVTPGTVVEPAILDDRRNNYLVAAVLDTAQSRAGLAYTDITTGEFAATQFLGPKARHQLVGEIDRLAPAEVLTCHDDIGNLLDLARAGDTPGPGGGTPALTLSDRWPFELETARQRLLDHFRVASLEGFGLAGQPLAIRAAGGLLHYLGDTQRARLGQLASLRTYTTEHFMTLDAATRRNLELTETLRSGSVQGSLLGVLDMAQTSMGGRLLRRWLNQPLLNREELTARLDAVEDLHADTPARTRLRKLLTTVSDVERLANRAVQGITRPRELIGIRDTLAITPSIRQLVDKASRDGGQLRALLSPDPGQGLALDPCEEVGELITQAITDEPPALATAGGVIRSGFSAELDNIVAASTDARAWVANLERQERARTGIKSLKVGYNKVFGYYLEVTKANADRVPPDYHRKQTLVNAERYITPELKEYETLILNAEERMAELEVRIFGQVVEQVAASANRLLALAGALASLDVYSALAEAAVQHRYTRPELTDGEDISIVAGRHPVVEVTRRDEPFVPNDVRFRPDELILLVTGPNMAGKSTYLRQVALIVLMAQVGSFVPADEARIGLVDRIFTRIGAQDEISAGQSTFMIEMIETANLLNHATRRSLLILDEVGRGTSTYDGISIAWAVVEHIHNHPGLQCKTLFATHYHELTQLADLLPHVRNYNVAVAEERDRVVFLRRIVPGGADRSYGIHVAQLAGLPRPVVQRATEILEELEQEARAPGTKPRTLKVRQLPLFYTSDPIRERLNAWDISTMTPLEAISKLYELQQEARDR